MWNKWWNQFAFVRSWLLRPRVPSLCVKRGRNLASTEIGLELLKLHSLAIQFSWYTKPLELVPAKYKEILYFHNGEKENMCGPVESQEENMYLHGPKQRD
jgi:hypothetical protein